MKTLLYFSLICGCCSACQSNATQPAAQSGYKTLNLESDTPAHQQVLVVITAHWDSLKAIAYAMEWQDGGWKLLRSHPAVVGKHGLGWGIGQEDYRDLPGPVKQEGDRRSPAGLFTLGNAFGRFAPEALPKLGLPYEPLVWETMCIEDTASRFYNQLMKENDPRRDWTQRDRMTRKDELYDLGAFVNHNVEPKVPGAGSCILLHLWRNEREGTLGCTAMALQDLVDDLSWMVAEKNPVLLQVPREEFSVLAGSLGLTLAMLDPANSSE